VGRSINTNFTALNGGRAEPGAPKNKNDGGESVNIAKRLLLGSAAGLITTAAAQAADLPVKAKPAEYVKVCSLYGAGFWYVPGTDTCLKIGSYIRVQTMYNADNGGVATGAGDGGSGGHQTRTDSANFAFRNRNVLSVDLRTQTEYGTLRSYMNVGSEWTTTSSGTAGNNAAAADSLFVNRGFIQFAGFTAGRIRSYFDINSLSPYSYSRLPDGDTGSKGIYGLAYTAQFGNGFTATLSFEDNGEANGGRGLMVSNVNMTEWTTGGASGVQATSFDNKGQQMPDVIGSLRVDQAWGYAQLSSALHNASGGYYGGVNSTVNGHPADKFGFAVAGGFTINNVLGMRGDSVGMQATYSEGAAGFATRRTGPQAIYTTSSNAGFGWLSEGLYTAGSAVELTTVWLVDGFYQHFWNPKWRTSLWASYTEVDYNGAERAMVCAGAGGGLTPGFISGLSAVSNCNPNYSWVLVGTRTQWNPHPDLDIGVELMWTHLNTAFKGTATLAASGAQPAIVGAHIDDQDELSVLVRFQRNFLP
jgi:Porin subfamily